MNECVRWVLLSRYVHGDCFRPISQLHTCRENLFSHLGVLCGMLPNQHLQINKLFEEISSSELTLTGWVKSNTKTIN